MAQLKYSYKGVAIPTTISTVFVRRVWFAVLWIAMVSVRNGRGNFLLELLE